MEWNPATTPNFSRDEMQCKCGCGRCEMRQNFMDMLQALRNVVGPLSVNSGYRCPDHHDEAEKVSPGAHSQGRAVDIQWPASMGRYEIVQLAMKMGFIGIGFEGEFLHLDNGHDHKHRPAMWTY